MAAWGFTLGSWETWNFPLSTAEPWVSLSLAVTEQKCCFLEICRMKPGKGKGRETYVLTPLPVPGLDVPAPTCQAAKVTWSFSMRIFQLNLRRHRQQSRVEGSRVGKPCDNL